MAKRGSKDLLRLETDSATTSSTSGLESKLLVCGKESSFSRLDAPSEKSTMFPLPKSQVLGKVKDFLSVFEESNKKLLNDAKDNRDNYDIEVLSGKESEYIEMDLMLGIADLHTPEAVAAAEAALAGKQPRIPLEESSSDSEDDDSSTDDEESTDHDDDDDDGNDKSDMITRQDDDTGKQSSKLEYKDSDGNSLHKASKKQKPNKRPKIVEIS